MDLYLSARDVTIQGALTSALLSPLAYPDFNAWRSDVTRRLRTLFRADHTMFAVPRAQELDVYSEDIDAGVVARVSRSRWAILQDPSFDPPIQRWFALQRQKAIEAYSDVLIEQFPGNPLRQSVYCNEVLYPAGMRHCQELLTTQTLPGSLLSVIYRKPEASPFGEAGTQLMRLLLPAFKAGLATWHRFETHRKNLADTFDRLGEAAYVACPKGRELYRNRSLVRLLSGEPEPEALLAEVRLVARQCGGLHAGGTADVGTLPVREVRTRTAGYRLRAGLLAPGLFDADAAVLVTVEPVQGPPPAPSLPTAATLRERFGLTEREAEITLLLADGLSNPEIARRLFISRHTVRHHAERIFAKLDITSRKALALRLLQDPADEQIP